MPSISTGELHLLIFALENKTIQNKLLENAKAAASTLYALTANQAPFSKRESIANINALRNYLGKILAGHARSGEDIQLVGLSAEEYSYLAQVTEALDELPKISDKLIKKSIRDGYLPKEGIAKTRYDNLHDTFIKANGLAEKAVSLTRNIIKSEERRRMGLFGSTENLRPFSKAALVRSPKTAPLFSQPNQVSSQSTDRSLALPQKSIDRPNFQTIREILAASPTFDPRTWERIAEELVNQGWANDFATAINDLSNPGSSFRRALFEAPHQQDLVDLFTREAELIETLTRKTATDQKKTTEKLEKK